MSLFTAAGIRTSFGAPELEQFITHLAVWRKVSAATQNQATSPAPATTTSCGWC